MRRRRRRSLVCTRIGPGCVILLPGCFVPRLALLAPSCAGRARSLTRRRVRWRGWDRTVLRPELVAALMGLSPDQRAAVFLHHVADMPIREVARLTGSPVATVKVRLHRARRALRASLVLVGDADG